MAETHFPLQRLADAMRADGVACVIRPGAQGRSARNFAAVGYYQGCQAVVQHHSVSSGLYPMNDITYIEGGKGVGYVISNAYTALDGTVYLIASGPTYTEGAGGPWGIIPANRANDVCFSNEIASWGAEDSVYPGVQQKAVQALAYHAGRIAAEVWSWPDDPFGQYRAFSHFEWAPGRKIDPRGVSMWSPNGGMWDMAWFRNDLRDYQGDDDMRNLRKPERAYDSRPNGQNEVDDLLRRENSSVPQTPIQPGETRSIVVGYCTDAFVSVTTVGQGGSGFLSVNDPTASTSIINYSGEDRIETGSAPVSTPNGRITITCGGSAPTHFIVDVWARKP